MSIKVLVTECSEIAQKEVYPSFLPDLENRKNLREMDVISNLEVVRDLEFDSDYINSMIQKFSLTPILCHKCNDFSKFFMNPEHHTNQLYIKNARWVKNSNASDTMDIFPYNSLKLPIYDISNSSVCHPKQEN